MSSWQKGRPKSLNHKQSLSEAAKNRSDDHCKKIASANSKTYCFISPEDEIVTINNMREFCRDNSDLDRRSML